MNKGQADFVQWKACGRKKPFTEAEAKQNADRMKQRAYHCRYCGHWHLSSSLNTLVAATARIGLRNAQRQ